MFRTSILTILALAVFLTMPGKGRSAEQSVDDSALRNEKIERAMQFARDVELLEDESDQGKHIDQARQHYLALSELYDVAAEDESFELFQQQITFLRKIKRVAYLAPLAQANLDELLQSGASDGTDAVQEFAKQQLLSEEIRGMDAISEDERHELSRRTMAFVIETNASSQSRQVFNMLTTILSYHFGDHAQASELCFDLAAKLEKQTHDPDTMFVEQLRGMGRRYALPGKSIVIEGKTLDGAPFDLKAYRGKVLLIDFWSTHCAPCVAAFPELKKYRDAYAPEFEVIAINMWDSHERIAEFVQERSIPWVNLHDPSPESRRTKSDANSLRYGVYSIPVSILVGRDGKVISIWALGSKLDELLAEEFPDVEIPTAASEE